MLLYIPQFFSHVGMFSCLAELNQCEAESKVSSSQNKASCESQTKDPLIPSLKLYQLSHCALLHNLFLDFCTLFKNSADPDWLASDEASQSGSTLIFIHIVNPVKIMKLINWIDFFTFYVLV